MATRTSPVLANATRSFAGGKKSNGHKQTCSCPICMNMKKKKGGDETLEKETSIDTNNLQENVGNNEVIADDSEYKELDLEGGSKKNKRTTKRNRKSRKHRKTRRHRRRSNKHRK